ncbi:MAG: DNA-protecting protein DprA, partial [Lachnospiraceae bacterium]|nr:DNA-protecting protein DprA [Lachnospiraceae bacterium]
MERILYSAREKQAAYQLINIKGIGKQSAIKLIEYAGSALEAMQLQEQEVRQCLPLSLAESFIRGRENLTERTVEWLEKEKDLRFIPFTSPEYPEKLRNLTDPPFALYVRGELPQENLPAVAIVGARACSEYGKSVAGYFGRRLGALGIQIISGMAKGIDGIAQQGAIDGGGTTYAVLGSGADVIYPPENAGLYQSIRTKGGILSEYPPGTEAQSVLFPQRNRIISGLADILLVV